MFWEVLKNKDSFPHFYVSFLYLENVGRFKIWKKTSIFFLCELFLLSIISSWWCHFSCTLSTKDSSALLYSHIILPSKCMGTIPLLLKEATSLLPQWPPFFTTTVCLLNLSLSRSQTPRALAQASPNTCYSEASLSCMRQMWLCFHPAVWQFLVTTPIC